LVTKKFRKRTVVKTWEFKLDGPSKLHTTKNLEGTSLCSASSQKKK